MRASCPHRLERTHDKWHCHPCLTMSIQEQTEELKYLRRIAQAARAYLMKPDSIEFGLDLDGKIKAWAQTPFYGVKRTRRPKKNDLPAAG